MHNFAFLCCVNACMCICVSVCVSWHLSVCERCSMHFCAWWCESVPQFPRYTLPPSAPPFLYTHLSLSLSLLSFSSLGDSELYSLGCLQFLDRQTDERLKDCCLISVAVCECIGADTWSELSETSSLVPEGFDWQLLNLYKSPKSEWECGNS